MFCFSLGKTTQVSWRLEQLKNLLKMLDENDSLLCEALYKDLRKPKQVAGIICYNRVVSFMLVYRRASALRSTTLEMT